MNLIFYDLCQLILVIQNSLFNFRLVIVEFDIENVEVIICL